MTPGLQVHYVLTLFGSKSYLTTGLVVFSQRPAVLKAIESTWRIPDCVESIYVRYSYTLVLVTATHLSRISSHNCTSSRTLCLLALSSSAVGIATDLPLALEADLLPSLESLRSLLGARDGTREMTRLSRGLRDEDDEDAAGVWLRLVIAMVQSLHKLWRSFFPGYRAGQEACRV